MFKILLIMVSLSVSIYGFGKTDLEKFFEIRRTQDKSLASIALQREYLNLRDEDIAKLEETEFELEFRDLGREEVELLALQRMPLPGMKKQKHFLLDVNKRLLELKAQEIEQDIQKELGLYYIRAVEISGEEILEKEGLELLQNLLQWQNESYQMGALSISDREQTGFEIRRRERSLKLIDIKKRSLTGEMTRYLGIEISPDSINETVTELSGSEMIRDLTSDPGQNISIQIAELLIEELTIEKRIYSDPALRGWNIMGGLGFDTGSGQLSALGGIGMEVALFSGRKRDMQMAQIRISAANEDLKGVMESVMQDLKELSEKYTLLEAALTRVRNETLPESRQLYVYISEDHRAGIRPFSDVVETGLMINDLKREILELQIEMLSVRLEINILTGRYVYDF